MGAISMKDFWPFRCDGPEPAVTRDADRLVRIYGEQAYDTAGLYSWREDIGLLYTSKPGHWHRVRLEIAQRNGQPANMNVVKTAKIQMLHLM